MTQRGSVLALTVNTCANMWEVTITWMSGDDDDNVQQGGITCGTIEDPRKSSKAIDERVIINFRDKNGVIARFRDKNVYR